MPFAMMMPFTEFPHPEEPRSGVSKDGHQTKCSFLPFETHPCGTLLRVRFVS
jgi:hypothetical protein